MNVVYATHDFFSSFLPLLGGKVAKTSEDIEQADLVVFTGGEDVSPELYGEVNRHSYPNIHRDKIEVAIFDLAFEMDKKMLGVCRGHQFLNVMTGGRLTQDLYHSSLHGIEWIEGTPLKEVLPLRVNSMHHQGFTLEQTSPLLKPLCLHGGIVEATMTERFITTQFHPEFMNWEPFFEYVSKVWISSK